jgi:hypothetical protein
VKRTRRRRRQKKGRKLRGKMCCKILYRQLFQKLKFVDKCKACVMFNEIFHQLGKGKAWLVSAGELLIHAKTSPFKITQNYTGRRPRSPTPVGWETLRSFLLGLNSISNRQDVLASHRPTQPRSTTNTKAWLFTLSPQPLSTFHQLFGYMPWKQWSVTHKISDEGGHVGTQHGLRNSNIERLRSDVLQVRRVAIAASNDQSRAKVSPPFLPRVLVTLGNEITIL